MDAPTIYLYWPAAAALLGLVFLTLSFVLPAPSAPLVCRILAVVAFLVGFVLVLLGVG